MTQVLLLRDKRPGVRPQKDDLRPRGILVNISDRVIVYRDEDGEIAEWSAAEMPDELWNRFTDGFELMRA